MTYGWKDGAITVNGPATEVKTAGPDFVHVAVQPVIGNQTVFIQMKSSLASIARKVTGPVIANGSVYQFYKASMGLDEHP